MEQYTQTATSSIIQRASDGAFIPTDPRNRDYQDFLNWQTAGHMLTPYAAPAPAVPNVITNMQCRAALMLPNCPIPSPVPGQTVFTLVDNYIKAQGGITLQAWEYANEFTRNGVTLTGVATQFNITPAQLDALFIFANTISA